MLRGSTRHFLGKQDFVPRVARKIDRSECVSTSEDSCYDGTIAIMAERRWSKNWHELPCTRGGDAGKVVGNAVTVADRIGG